GVENVGMLTVTDEGEYQLRYNDLIAPMIKAIQELKEENEKKDAKITELEQQLNKVMQVLNEMKVNVKKVKLSDHQR
ncbi:MAG: hypothetical protein N2510_10400, partial [Ignavibacteria bacterium]|nr:hypothetical protein [Ignavibacteria bacterium]